MIFIRSKNVPEFGDYRLYRDAYLRPDFRYRCAYCLIHEQLFHEVGGGEIDHYRPLNPPRKTAKDFGHLINSYENLYWTCAACNGAKGNKWPSDEEQNSGYRFLDPCQENHSDHWDVDNHGKLHPRTRMGEYTVTEIRLNRAFLVRTRRRFIERQQQVAEVRELLFHSDLGHEEKAKIDGYLANDFLLDPPAFEI